MFLVTISKTPGPVGSPPGLERHDWSHGAFNAAGWKVAAWIHPFLSEVVANSERFVVSEAAPRTGAGPRMELVTVALNARDMTGAIRRVANSGRPVLHHLAADGSIVIASHFALLKWWGVVLKETPGILPELYLYRQACPPQTLVANVRQLAAGDGAELTHEKGSWLLRRLPNYMPPAADPRNAGGTGDKGLVAGMRKAVEEAILRTNTHGAQVGCLLSGGLDSSVITSVLKAHEQLSDTFSCVYPFEDAHSDTEYRYATTAARAIGTHHTVHIPTMCEYLHGTLDAIADAEEPVMHLQSVLVHLLCKDVLRPRGYSVIPCGEGADGMFGGRLQRLLTAFSAKPYRKLALEVPGVSRVLREISKRTNRWGMIAELADKKWSSTTSFSDPEHILWTLAIFGDRAWIREHLKCSAAEMVGGRPEVMMPYLGRDLRDCTSILRLSESAETQVIWNKLGEAHGMCVTYPYLDTQVSDLTYSIPWEAKLAGPKPLLRAVARNLGIDEAIVSRPKASFDIDAHKWGPRGGVFEPLVSLALPVMDEQDLRSLQSAYVFRAHTLWTVLNYAIWKRIFLQNESISSLHAELDTVMEKMGLSDSYRTPGRVLGGTGTRAATSLTKVAV